MSSSSVNRPASSTPDARTRWFHEARFGIFIHWGVYAVPAGEYQGRPVGWIGEWIMHSAEIPVADYRAFARAFTASAFDAHAWADLFHDTGARYVIITAKHHEGFSLYDSPTSEWNSVKSAPAGRDLLAPLAQAVRAHGLKFGLYYSQAQDWVHRGGAYYNRDQAWDPAQAGDFDAYLRDIALPQTRELIARYSPDILWWDTPVNMTRERARPFAELLAANPAILTNDRLGGDYPGDTKTPEQHIPPRGYPGEMFEVCMTMNETWGFKKTDHDWKSSRAIIRNLSDIASKGGNFLLNIGPDAAGRIPEPSIKILKDLGLWMRINSDAIYATAASPFPRRLPWGRVTQKTYPDGSTTLFLHIWEWPTDGRLLLPTLLITPTAARMLASGAAVSFAQTGEGVVLSLPGHALDPDVTVVRVELPSAPVVTQTPWSAPGADGAFTLHAFDADTHGSLAGNITVEGRGPDAVLARWHSHEFRVEYVLKCPAAGRWRVEAEATASAPVRLRVKCGSTETVAPLPATPAPLTPVMLGEIDLPAGDCLLELIPEREGWSSIDVRTVRLVPLPPSA
jgi:alpha-L-fucosidase